jgi:predicted Ser/Thr protein kinase
MRDNLSYFPSDHIHPLQILENMNHPMIPKLISYDNETYTCERIEGMPLEKYVRKTRDPAFALKLMHDINDFMRELTTHTKAFKENDGPLVNYQLFCDDIHESNLIITEDAKAYIIDFDQFGFFHPYTVFSLMEIASTKLNRSIRDNLLLADTLYIEDIKNSYKNRVTELEEQLLDYV